jgi:hypothetical protein
MNDGSTVVRLLEAEDIPTTAALLAAAFDEDPAYGFLFPDRHGRRAGLEDFFTRNLHTHLPFRCAHVGVAEGAVGDAAAHGIGSGRRDKSREAVVEGCRPYATHKFLRGRGPVLTPGAGARPWRTVAQRRTDLARIPACSSRATLAHRMLSGRA